MHKLNLKYLKALCSFYISDYQLFKKQRFFILFLELVILINKLIYTYFEK